MFERVSLGLVGIHLVLRVREFQIATYQKFKIKKYDHFIVKTWLNFNEKTIWDSKVSSLTLLLHYVVPSRK